MIRGHSAIRLGQRALLALLVMLVLLVLSPVAHAQRVQVGQPIRNRPFATERETPSTREAPGVVDLGAEVDESERVLPPLPVPSSAELDALGAQAGLVIRELDVTGNTVFSDEVLTQAVATYLGRPLDSADLERIRRALTAVYVDAGYVSSGATLPEQDVRDGRLRIEITEGRLAEIRIQGTKRYRPSVLRKRLDRVAGSPVRVKDLESALRVLSQDPRIARLDARLEPGPVAGTSILRVMVEEADPASLVFAFDNYETPSVGSYAGHADVAHANPLGLGDFLGSHLTVTEGLYRVDGSYAIPVHPSGTELTFDLRYSDAEILDDAVKALDITNESLSYSFGVRQTLYRTPRDWLDAGLAFDRRWSRSKLDGDPYSFVEGTENGRSELSVLRADGSWTRRGRSSALTLRTIFSWGLDALGSTIQHGSAVVREDPITGDLEFSPGDPPDGVFFSWVGQLRYLYRFEATGIEVGLRGDLQLSDRPLLPLEQFAIGGPGSVRGYRTNQLAADEGFASGVDVRLPLWRTDTGRSLVSLVPFYEIGRIWNHERSTQGKRTLSSLGAGIELEPHPDITFQLDWAGAFRDSHLGHELQDHGVTFRVTWRAR